MRKESGSSLLQVLVAIAVFSVVLTGFLSMVSAQMRQTTMSEQKLSELDLARTLTSHLSDGSVCNYVATHPVPAPIDPATIGTVSSPKFSVPQLPIDPAGGGAPLIIADGTTPASPMTAALVVTSIVFEDLECVQTPCSVATTLLKSNLTVSFDATKLVMGFKPLKFPVVLKTKPAPADPTKLVVDGCVGASTTTPTGTVTPGTLVPGDPGLPAPGACSNWTVPNFNTLTVRTWGAGGGGGAFYSGSGAVGGRGTRFGNLVAAGGGGPGSTFVGWSYGPPREAFGGAGSGTGNSGFGGDGGQLDDFCTHNDGGSSPSGGKGGGGGKFQLAKPAGDNGVFPGGGGGGGGCAKTWQGGGGGGGGGYSERVLIPSDVAAGSQVLICVGAGGKGSKFNIFNGGDGANGAISLEWK